MLELPEVLTITRQMQAELPGKRIASAIAGASPHKFAFFNRPAGEYASLLAGRTIGPVFEKSAYIVTAIEPDMALLFGDVGGRILFHRDTSTLPAKHQLLLTFEDGSALTLSIVLWGGVKLGPMATIDKEIWSLKRMSPMSAGFSVDAFQRLLADPEEQATRSAKRFMISKPGLCGVGNGCLQDILFRAKIHPRRRMVTLSAQEQRALYDATIRTIGMMVKQGGRAGEVDLYGHAGGYQTILDSKAAGKPCPVCGALIEKIAYLGGAAYFCPSCQPLPTT
jgi:formamidopyrimidine-DNA glycosylase